MKKLMTLALAFVSIAAMAQNNGGISPQMLAEIQKGWQGTPSDKALRNALNTTPQKYIHSLLQQKIP